MQFTESQRRAIEAWGSGDVCVTAGPGSGKTTVLVERIRRLVEVHSVEPERIAAITFTRKAATSMQARLLKGVSDTTLRERLQKVQASTIHAFCSRLLKENAVAAGLDPEFRLIEEADALRLLRSAVERALDEVRDEDPSGAEEFLREFKGTRGFDMRGDGSSIHAELAQLVEAVRGHGRELFAQTLECAEQRAREWIVRAGNLAVEIYQRDKGERSALDYTDLEKQTFDLLGREGLELRLPFEHLLVDENQDTNPLQMRLVRRLAKRSAGDPALLFAVGDVNQSIYAFRNADPEGFTRFRKRVQEGGEEIPLYDNFRSRPEILRAVETLTRSVTSEEGVEPQKSLEARTLKARRELPPKDEPSVEVRLVFGERDVMNEREALWTARRIAELRGELRLGPEQRRPDWRDFAVLVRKNAQLGQFAEGLRRMGVPYHVAAGRGFFDAQEVRDLLCLLRVFDNAADDVSLAAVVRSPMVGLSDETLLRVKPKKRRLIYGLLDAPQLGADQQERLTKFLRWFETLRAERERVPADVLLHRAMAASGYQAFLLAGYAGMQRSANVDKLARLAGRAGDEGRASFRETLERLEAMRDSGGGEPEAGVPEETADGVHLLTVHTAKGLEYPVVFLPALHSKGNTDTDALLFDPKEGLGAAWRSVPTVGPRGGKKLEDRVDEVYERLAAPLKERLKAEDDRLFYVAATRAEEHVVLSAAFPGKPRRDSWAKRLKDDLDAPWELGAKEPLVIESEGFSYRFDAVDEDPPLTLAEGTTASAQVERLPVLDEGGQADSEASVTAVALYSECPRRYLLSRSLGLDEAAPAPRDEDRERPAEPSDELDASELGKAVHGLLAGEISEAPARAHELAGVFEESELGRRAASGTADRERSILFPLDDRLLRGRIDLLFEEGGERVLVDYKTDQVAANEARGKSAAYALQLQLYAVGLELAGEKPDRAVLHYLRPDVLVEVDLSENALGAARRAASEFFKAQEALEYPMDLAPRCRRCPHYGKSCPAEIAAAAGTETQQPRGQLQLEF